MLKYIFGPVKSRRFGLSLGIDLSPDFKSCNFDCLYCELNRGEPVNRIVNEPPVDQIVKEVKEYLEKNDHPDVITVTSNGEPTLYSQLDSLIDILNSIKGRSKTLILSNGSTIYRRDTQNILKKFDIVKISLDTVDEKTFRKIDRPSDDISLSQIIKGLKTFRDIYRGELVIEIMVVKGINDSTLEMEKIAEVLKNIKPDRIDIGTVDRPPAYRVRPVSDEELFKLSEIFEGFNINVVTRGNDGIVEKRKLSEDQILKTLKRRPFTYSDIESIFDRETAQRTYRLLKEGILKTKKVGSVTFIYSD
ncbi:MAG TPA: radical SAM protein [Persephonella sp.]|nr:radical SAM protein [Persephonella sp.]